MNKLIIILEGLIAQLILWVPTKVAILFYQPHIDTGFINWILLAGSLLIVLVTAMALTIRLEQVDPSPVSFDESNHDWLKPDGMTDDECGSLPAYVDDDQSISCWRMSYRDRLRLLLSGRVWVGVLASGQQPPIWITIKKPFQTQKIKDTENGKEKERTV